MKEKTLSSLEGQRIFILFSVKKSLPRMGERYAFQSSGNMRLRQYLMMARLVMMPMKVSLSSTTGTKI